MESSLRRFVMKKFGWIAVVAAAVVLLPLSLVAQIDPNLPPAAGPQGATPANESQPSAGPSSMRETLGAPGQTGQQLLDKAFVRTATEDGIADVKLGQLAVQKGGVNVKTLAQKLVDDHTSINKEMAAVADSLGVMPSKNMSKDDQAEYNKLNGLSGKDFDTEYITFITKAHWQKTHDFYMEASVAADPGLAAEVVKAMQTMRSHLGLITQVAAQDGITLPPRPPRPPRPGAGPPPPPPAAKQ
jgi:putative membrane protein